MHRLLVQGSETQVHYSDYKIKTESISPILRLKVQDSEYQSTEQTTEVASEYKSKAKTIRPRMIM